MKKLFALTLALLIALRATFLWEGGNRLVLCQKAPSLRELARSA
jgi:hypothetical protein